MKAIRGLVAGLTALVLLFSLGAYVFFRDSDTLRFRMTIAVDTPEGVRAGSSVMEATMTGGAPVYRQIDPGTYYVRGQAPYVELGDSKVLFAGLGNPLNLEQMLRILQKFLDYRDIENPLDKAVRGADWRESFPAARKRKPRGVLKLEDYPFMITFGDVRRTETVRAVAPEAFAATFGPGYALREITLEVVGNSIELTDDFEERFPEIAKNNDAFAPFDRHSGRASQLDRRMRAPLLVRRD